MTSNSLTAIVARDFRGTTLFLKSFVEAHSTFIWSKNRTDAESFPISQALAIVKKANRDWGSDAYAMDSAGEILKPADVRRAITASRTEARRLADHDKGRETVHCLIFDHPSQLGDYVLVLNSLCSSAEAARIFLEDRIANGQAFSSERCAMMQASEYERRNANGGI